MEQAVDRLVRWPLEIVGLLAMASACFVPELALHLALVGYSLVVVAAREPVRNWLLLPIVVIGIVVTMLCAAIGRRKG